MSDRTERYVHYHNSLWEINERAASDPVSFAAESEQAYRSALTRIARRAAHDRADCRVVLLAGPSASGKTTTASLLSKALETFGMSSFVFSLDNFYRSEDETPRQEDGTPDFESVEALDIAAIRECLLSLITKRRCEMPIFDFERHRPAENKLHVELPPRSLVLMEGLHALNPVLSEGMPRGRLLHAYLSVKQGVDGENSPLLSPNDMRLIRRLVRDARFRACPAERTLAMWPNVVAGEDKYIRPYRMSADYTVNSIHIYEPCVLRSSVIPLLRSIPEDSPHYRKARDLDARLMRFEPVDPDLVPENSMLREFLGPKGAKRAE